MAPTFMKNTQSYVNCSLVRGGTSKGLMFLEKDLPSNLDSRCQIFLKLLGAPDKFFNQIQGLGGGKSTNNKIGVVKKSSKKDIDLDFTFYQIQPNSSKVDILLNCGNFIAAAPIFAIVKNLIKPQKRETTIKIYNENTGQIVHATIKTHEKGIIVKGTHELDGISGEFSPIGLKFIEINNKTIFPTGNLIDEIDGVRVTISNITVNMIIIDGDDLGINAQTSIFVLQDENFVKKIRDVRKKAINLMNLPEEYLNFSTPKISIVCNSEKNYSIKSYYYDPFALHDSYAVTGGICLASVSLIKGTVPNKFLTSISKEQENFFSIEHRSGVMEIILDFEKDNQIIKSASIVRTATILMDGKAYLYN